MRVNIDIAADVLTVRRYEGDELLSAQRYAPLPGQDGSFACVVPFPHPLAHGGRYSCMVFFHADGGGKGDTLDDSR
jgi:hypothetical protein